MRPESRMNWAMLRAISIRKNPAWRRNLCTTRKSVLDGRSSQHSALTSSSWTLVLAADSVDSVGVTNTN